MGYFGVFLGWLGAEPRPSAGQKNLRDYPRGDAKSAGSVVVPPIEVLDDLEALGTPAARPGSPENHDFRIFTNFRLYGTHTTGQARKGPKSPVLLPPRGPGEGGSG